MYTPEQIEALIRQCADRCIMPYFQNLSDDQIGTKTTATDFVTIADREAEAFLERELPKILPGSFVLGEENYSLDKSLMLRGLHAEDIWIADPVDGTKTFRHGGDNFVLMLAHVHCGHLSGAWIFAPRHDLFAAWQKGFPVTVNGREVKLDTAPKPLSHIVVADHIGHFRPQDRAQLFDNRKAFAGRMSLGSVGYETIRMLLGEIDALSFRVGNPWDVAPCAAMVTALGGSAMKLDAKPMQGENLLTVGGAFLACCSPGQWQEIRDAMVHNVNWKAYFD